MPAAEQGSPQDSRLPGVPEPLRDPEYDGPISPPRETLKALGHATYWEYICSQHWKGVKRAYRASALPQDCDFCGDPKVDLHHKTYERLGAERLDDILPLCHRCHCMVHFFVRQGTARLDLAGFKDASRALIGQAVLAAARLKSDRDRLEALAEAAAAREKLPLDERVRQLATAAALRRTTVRSELRLITHMIAQGRDAAALRTLRKAEAQVHRWIVARPVR